MEIGGEAGVEEGGGGYTNLHPASKVYGAEFSIGHMDKLALHQSEKLTRNHAADRPETTQWVCIHYL